MLQRRIIDDEIDDLGADVEMIHQRGRLGRRSKACDRLSRRLEAVQKLAELGLHSVDVASEGAKALSLVEPQPCLDGQCFADRGPDLPGTASKLSDAAQRTAMGGDALRLDQFHPMCGEEADQGTDRMIGKMLVIDRVEQGLLDDIDEI